MIRGRERYLRDRAERRTRGRERRDMGYMDYREYERYPMDYEHSMQRDRNYDYDYDMRRNYDYRDSRRSRDYADEMDEEYHEDLKNWTEKLKRKDRFGLSKEQIVSKGKEMGITYSDYEPEEFYAIYLMHVTDYPNIANDPHTYLAMAKSWLEDKDLNIEPSEKVCKYLYEIVMADED